MRKEDEEDDDENYIYIFFNQSDIFLISVPNTNYTILNCIKHQNAIGEAYLKKWTNISS